MILQDLLNTLPSLATEEAWEFLQASHVQELKRTTSISHVHALLEEACESVLRDSQLWPSPKEFGRRRYFLHAFCGRRRLGDFSMISTRHSFYIPSH